MSTPCRWVRHDATPESLEALKARIGSRALVLSISGGKDSAAMAKYMEELGLPYTSIFMDTGWELPETYTYLEEVLPKHIGPIELLKTEIPLAPDDAVLRSVIDRCGIQRTIEVAMDEGFLGPETSFVVKRALLEAAARGFEARLGRYSPMVRLILKKGMFPARVRRFCTSDLKVKPARDYMQNHEDEVLNVVGIRAEESAARATYPEWEWEDGYDAEMWRPLLHAKVDDVIRLHHRHGLPPSPLYTMGASRVGCAPCIYARKHEIRMLYSIAPARFELIQDLETVVGLLARLRATIKGEVFRTASPTWFQNPSRAQPTGNWICVDSECGAVMLKDQARVSRPEGARYGRDDVVEDIPELHGSACWTRDGESAEWVKQTKRAGDCWPIQKVIQWSHTKRGGKEFEPFAPLPSEEGCMRWGVCDTSWTGREGEHGMLLAPGGHLTDAIAASLEQREQDSEEDCMAEPVQAFETFEGKTKACPRCGETKDIEEGFGVRRIRKKKGGPVVRIIPQSYCRPCRTKKPRTTS